MRTREGRLLKRMRVELIAHVGGKPSATQRAMIDQCAQLRLRLAVMDRAFAQSGGAMTAHDTRTYLAWANSYSRLLRQLGLQGVAERAPTLAEILATPAASVPIAAADAAADDAPAAEADAASGPPAASVAA